jgi:hypothetical protein
MLCSQNSQKINNYDRTKKSENVPQNEIIASLDQINPNELLRTCMQNLNVAVNVMDAGFGVFANELMRLGDKPSQRELETVLAGHTMADVIALDTAGVKLSGSAERALSAFINKAMTEVCKEIGSHWSTVEHRESTPLAKALQPLKTACFTAWQAGKHSNPSTKWKRVRDYGFELANPKIAAPIGEGAEGEGEGESSTTSRTRDLYERFVVEIAKLYRAGMSAENDAVIKNHAQGDKITAALESITTALQALDAPLEDEDLVAFVKSVSK